MAERVGSKGYMEGEYAEYQARYRAKPKESDEGIFSLLSKFLSERREKHCVVMDVGCHTGNLLYHLKNRFPGLELVGGDIFPEIVEQCRKDPALDGVKFEVMDLLGMDLKGAADVLILSAVMFRFNDDEHERAWRAIASAIRPGGAVIVFDFYHQFRQTVRIADETDAHPKGLILTLRSQTSLATLLHDVGFSEPEFTPFKISIDLPLKDAADGVSTHTRLAKDGERLQFRGAIYQPWCHMLARKR